MRIWLHYKWQSDGGTRFTNVNKFDVNTGPVLRNLIFRISTNLALLSYPQVWTKLYRYLNISNKS